MPTITFLQHVPERARAARELQRIADRLSQPGVIELDLYAEGYTENPLDCTPTPQSYCRRLFDDATIERHLSALADRQQSDGGWPITWTPISQAVETYGGVGYDRCAADPRCV